MFQARSFTTASTFEVNVIMLMISFGTGFSTKRIPGGAIVIKHFMNKSALKKRFEGPVDSHPIIIVINFCFNISM